LILRKLFDYTWVIIKAADVDGLKMNEEWFRRPFQLFQPKSYG